MEKQRDNHIEQNVMEQNTTDQGGIYRKIRDFALDETGVGVIELVLILVVICTSRCPCVLCVYREILDVIWNMIHREEMFCVCSN